MTSNPEQTLQLSSTLYERRSLFLRLHSRHISVFTTSLDSKMSFDLESSEIYFIVEVYRNRRTTSQDD